MNRLVNGLCRQDATGALAMFAVIWITFLTLDCVRGSSWRSRQYDQVSISPRPSARPGGAARRRSGALSRVERPGRLMTPVITE